MSASDVLPGLEVGRRPLQRSVWLECGAARFQALLSELGATGCRLLVEACCCARMREGCEVAVELPPPLSRAGLLRLSGRLAGREAGEPRASSAQELLAVEFRALSPAQRTALGLAWPGAPGDDAGARLD